MRISFFKTKKDYELSVETMSKMRIVFEVLEKMMEGRGSLPDTRHTINIYPHTHTVKFRKEG